VAVEAFLPSGMKLGRVFRAPGAVYQVPASQAGLTLIDEQFVRRAHAAGRHVHAWTIDDPDEMDRLLDLGVDGLMTDRPDLMRPVLERRGQWWG
jgi:glycerophosphoryl diester phosphodiesterase